MFKKILILLALIINTSGYAMQSGQATAPQGQAQKPKPAKPKPTQNQTQEPVVLPTTTNDTTSQTDADTQVSTDTKKHVRICPTCGGIADNCAQDLSRRKDGILLPCACDDCC